MKCVFYIEIPCMLEMIPQVSKDDRNIWNAPFILYLDAAYRLKPLQNCVIAVHNNISD